MTNQMTVEDDLVAIFSDMQEECEQKKDPTKCTDEIKKNAKFMHRLLEAARASKSKTEFNKTVREDKYLVARPIPLKFRTVVANRDDLFEQVQAEQVPEPEDPSTKYYKKSEYTYEDAPFMRLSEGGFGIRFSPYWEDIIVIRESPWDAEKTKLNGVKIAEFNKDARFDWLKGDVDYQIQRGVDARGRLPKGENVVDYLEHINPDIEVTLLKTEVDPTDPQLKYHVITIDYRDTLIPSKESILPIQVPVPEIVPIVEIPPVVPVIETVHIKKTKKTKKTKKAPKKPKDKAWSQKELYQIAQQYDIPGRSKMTRKELLAATRVYRDYPPRRPLSPGRKRILVERNGVTYEVTAVPRRQTHRGIKQDMKHKSKTIIQDEDLELFGFLGDTEDDILAYNYANYDNLSRSEQRMVEKILTEIDTIERKGDYAFKGNFKISEHAKEIARERGVTCIEAQHILDRLDAQGTDSGAFDFDEIDWEAFESSKEAFENYLATKAQDIFEFEYMYE